MKKSIIISVSILTLLGILFLIFAFDTKHFETNSFLFLIISFLLFFCALLTAFFIEVKIKSDHMFSIWYGIVLIAFVLALMYYLSYSLIKTVPFQEKTDNSKINPPLEELRKMNEYKKEEQLEPYFSPDDIVDLNIKEIQLITENEINIHNSKYERTKLVDLKALGTNKFRVVGKLHKASKMYLKNNQCILYMLTRNFDRRPLKIGVQLNFPSEKDLEELDFDKYYKVTGELEIIVDTEKLYIDRDQLPENIRSEFPDKIKNVKIGLPAQITVLDIKQVANPKSDYIWKYSDRPPFHPIETEEINN